MNVVLISTYELGRQPFGLASPAAWLRNRGHNVVTLDLARQPLQESAVDSAALIALYLPMHTATRLAVELIPVLRKRNPGAHLCCYGLYAPMNEEFLRSLGVASILGGEFESALVHLADRLAQPLSCNFSQSESRISLDRLSFEVPDRSGLPPMEKYAHLIIPEHGYRIVGSTEASRGCKHRCRHCPVVPVYNGVFRIVSPDIVLEDIRQQVAAGAQHISFGDPDFFNGIGHALKIIEALHREFPDLTYDVTIKIEHLRKYEQHLSLLRQTGCFFVISAVESIDDAVLAALEKGHTCEDFLHVVRTFRSLGLTLHPTFLPFTPWTTLEGYRELLELLHAEGLVENVAPIQLGIRLLIPEGSRILQLEDIQKIVEPFDSRSLFYPWKHSDPRLDALSEKVQAIAAAAEQYKLTRSAAFANIWKAVHTAAGLAAPSLPSANVVSKPVPFLSEPWYCCAEPSNAQLVSIGSVSQQTVAGPTASPDGFV
jgi:radical SAM superfamily enzyme YgiQ (UPF0313 family)